MEILKSLSYPEEALALMKYRFGGCSALTQNFDPDALCPTLRRCYQFLDHTSRSFAAVIKALHTELRDAVCIFYLVLRALDTVEDDMMISRNEKIPLLQNFYRNLEDPDWRFTDSQERDAIVLLEFPVISGEYRALKPAYRKVISEICQKMGKGMTVYLDKSPGSLEQWNEYCHYVAGLVGIGLSHLFSASQLEDESLGQDDELANSMGLFLQKTNIIRDYLEDVNQGREFWPHEVWQKYCENLEDLARPDKRRDAVCCLNELVSNALQHIPDVIRYMEKIKDQSVFNFCAIPQVMAVATLERCYNNPQVFQRNVKIRKGEAVKLMMSTANLDSVKAVMTHFTKKIIERIPRQDPSVHHTRIACNTALEMCRSESSYNSIPPYLSLYVCLVLLLVMVAKQYWTGKQGQLGSTQV